MELTKPEQGKGRESQATNKCWTATHGSHETTGLITSLSQLSRKRILKPLSFNLTQQGPPANEKFQEILVLFCDTQAPSWWGRLAFMRIWMLFFIAAAQTGCQKPPHPPAPDWPTGMKQLSGPALQTVERSWNRLQKAPAQSEIWREWSFATHANGLLEEALAAHIALESLNPRLGDHFRKAVVLERLGRTPEAVATLQQLSDPSGTADRRLAKILLDQGELEKAFQAANRAREANPSDFGHLTVWCPGSQSE